MPPIEDDFDSLTKCARYRLTVGPREDGTVDGAGSIVLGMMTSAKAAAARVTLAAAAAAPVS
jgi:hypothetical protein